MLVVLLSALDFTAAVLMLLLHFHVSLGFITAVFAFYLIIKGVVYIKDPASIVDIIVGAYILFLFLGYPTPLTYVFFGYMLLKLALSLAHMA